MEARHGAVLQAKAGVVGNEWVGRREEDAGYVVILEKGNLGVLGSMQGKGSRHLWQSDLGTS